MGCGASTSNASHKDAVIPVPVTPEAEAEKDRGQSKQSNGSTTTGATSPDSGTRSTSPPGAVAVEDSNPEPPPMPPAKDGDEPEQYFHRERRMSHSSESNDPHNVQIVTHPKTDAEKTDIKKHLMESTNFLFKGLTDVRAGMLADAMFKKEVKAGEIVIEQGDDGDNFYLIGSGNMEVLVKRDPSSQPVKVLEYSAGGTFGELALMYLCPRAATVKAVSDCMLWCLERVQFRALMCDAEQQQAKSKWEPFLEKVQVFSTLNKFERMTLANDLEEEDCGKDEVVIEQGDDNAEFLYILEGGSCAAILNNTKEDKGPETLKEYAPGDYFGEVALLEGGPRRVSVKVTSAEAHFLKISTETFKGILDPVHDVMRKNAQAYKKLDDRA